MGESEQLPALGMFLWGLLDVSCGVCDSLLEVFPLFSLLTSLKCHTLPSGVEEQPRVPPSASQIPVGPSESLGGFWGLGEQEGAGLGVPLLTPGVGRVEWGVPALHPPNLTSLGVFFLDLFPPSFPTSETLGVKPPPAPPCKRNSCWQSEFTPNLGGLLKPKGVGGFSVPRRGHRAWGHPKSFLLEAYLGYKGVGATPFLTTSCWVLWISEPPLRNSALFSRNSHLI